MNAAAPGIPMSRAEALRLLGVLPGALLLLRLGGCAPAGPRDLRIGEEECARCRMRISEERFAAQLRTERGRSLAFDSVECLVDYVLDQEQDPDGERFRGRWVTDLRHPGRWVDAEDAVYLRSEGLRSPMGMGLSAYAERSEAERMQEEHGGDLLRWSELRRSFEAARQIPSARGGQSLRPGDPRHGT